MEIITEEMNLQEDWYKEAKGMTLENLPAFLRKLTEDYKHDYGTICNAMIAGSIATLWAMDKAPNGGITGFQAGCIMWGFIRQWNCSSNKTGLRLIDYDNFLYPQYEDKFEKTMSLDIWKGIQKAAEAEIEKADSAYKKHLKDVDQYESDIAAFVVKYPDYYENKKNYDPLGIGTGEQWKDEEKKKESGFEFAPQKPYEPVGENSTVYKHWKSITDGVLPFGYTVEDKD